MGALHYTNAVISQHDIPVLGLVAIDQAPRARCTIIREIFVQVEFGLDWSRVTGEKAPFLSVKVVFLYSEAARVSICTWHLRICRK